MTLARTGMRPRPVEQLSLRDLHREAQFLIRRHDKRKYMWRLHARPEQLEPADYFVWGIVAGRGYGKTRTGSETVKKWARKTPGVYAVVAKNDREVRRVCFELRRAGLLAVMPPEEVAEYKKGSGETALYLKNGSVIMAFSAEVPDNLRGYAFDGVWCDEFAAWSKKTAQESWDMLMMCLREAPNPHVVVTTTPKNVEHIRTLMAKLGHESGYVVTRGRTEDNRANLSRIMLAELERDYAGTRLGRQELGGELLEDVEHALWNLELIAAATWRFEAYGPIPEFTQVVTSVDPSGSEKGDATGIVTCARARPILHLPLDEEDDDVVPDPDGPMPAEEVLARARAAVIRQREAERAQVTPIRRDGAPVEQGPIVVISDATTKGTPEHRYSTACLEAFRHHAGVLLVEGAYGGDNTHMALRSSWADLQRQGLIPEEAPLPRIVNAPTDGSKADRAQPVVALYEQTANGGERIFHMPGGRLAALEDEQTTWEPDSTWSPNRMDALVHAVRYLTNTRGYQGSVGSATGMQVGARRAVRGRRRR